MAGNILNKGYTATLASKLTTELNSLADGSVTALGTEVDNTTDLDDVMDGELNLASYTMNSTAAYCTLYLIPSLDGTNYPDWNSGAKGNYHDQYAVATLRVYPSGAAGTKRAEVTAVPIPPCKFKLAIGNFTTVNLAGSGNTFGIRKYAKSYT